MLYDPKWEQKIDIYTTESLIAWLEKQPADTKYCFFMAGTCLIANYLKAMGVENYVLGSPRLNELGWHDIALGDLTQLSQTYGEALKRARAAL